MRAWIGVSLGASTWIAAVACGSSVTETATASASASASMASAGGASTASGGTGGSGGVIETQTVASSVSTVATTVAVSSSGNGGAGGGPTCPSFGDACSTCLSGKCAASYCSCVGNAACGQLFQCLQGCADDACRQACYTADEDGVSAAALLTDCGAGSCAMECPGSKPLSVCEKCLFTSCDIQMNHCFANAECLALFACIGTCAPNDMACRQQCAASHPAGLMDAQAVGMCSNASCQTECP